MAITNGYTTLAQFKTYLPIKTPDTVDDALIEQCIEAASRAIDKYTNRTFYARTQTRLYNVPGWQTGFERVLYLDDDLLTVTTLTNGDGTVIAAADYLLLPYNTSPKYAVRIKPTSGLDWQASADGETLAVISVAGTWGYSASAPDDIEQVCLMVATDLYKKRSGQGEEAAQVTGAGVVIRPAGMPKAAREMLQNYVRNTV